jgi:uncharacterized repeat protein (TIGR01451 family)
MNWLLGALLAMCATQAVAQEKGCILLKTVAEMEQITTDARGEQSTQLVPVEKVVPGNEVIYTVSATNICDQVADKVVIDNPVPEHMNYVANSAIGPGTDVTFSIDGGFHYGKPEALKVANPDGSQRQAEPAEYTNIRWVMRNPLKPGDVAFARFRAVLE